MTENIIPKPEQSKSCKNHWTCAYFEGLDEISSSLATELLEVQGVNSVQKKETFHQLIKKYDDM